MASAIESSATELGTTNTQAPGLRCIVDRNTFVWWALILISILLAVFVTPWGGLFWLVALAVDDISMPMDGYTLPAEEHVERLIAFAGAWDRGAPMVVHCFAGISRSSAAAYVAACALNPQREEADIAWALRRASRTAQPNTRIVSVADRLLKRDGRMIRAIDTIGPGDLTSEGRPFRLDLD